MGWVIDTSVWVDVERGRLSPGDVMSITGNEPVFISPVTIAELQFGVERSADAAVRRKREAALARLRTRPVLVIDEQTGEVFGRIAAEAAQRGRGHEFRVQDMWLASQAIQHNFKLLTLNARDFRDISGLQLAAPSSAGK